MTTRILIVEDRPADADLMEAELRRAKLDYDARRVMTRDQFEEALRLFRPDVVLSDHSLPQFNAMAAIQLARQLAPSVPIIVVTGSLDEESAVEYLKAGAVDYVLKDRMARLGSAVFGALQQQRTRQEKERAEVELRDSKERYEAMLDQARDGVLVTDPQGVIQEINRAAQVLFGRDRAALAGTSFFDVVDPADAGRAAEYFARSLLRLHEPEAFTLLTPDGRGRVTEVSASPVDVGGKRLALVMLRDITDRQRLEEQFRVAQKMEAVGQLAGGVAHDFNNLLTVIAASAEFALEQLSPDSRAAEDVREIRTAAERAAALTRQLLAFGRRQVLSPRAVDLNSVVGDMERLLKRLLGEDIDLVTRLAPAPPVIRADVGQLEQVIANLAVNARDAMPQGGKLTLETSTVELAQGHGDEPLALAPGPYALLAVSDTGVGIPPEVKGRIFEPFFTTKPPGKGTGLGLATAYGIVKQSGGQMWVYSEVGQGTTFKVYLPLDSGGEGQLSGRKTPIPAGTPAARGSETVLLVEDDESVRVLARRAMERAGFHVLEASTGEAALEVAPPLGGRIDILVTDLVLTGIGGAELAQRLRAAAPALRVLYISGYTPEAALRAGMVDAGTALLDKPFTADSLVRKIRNVLDASAE